jgi:very-short-patch-repair endonuclease
VVTRRQLLREGLSTDQIDRRLRGGVLHAVHRGVYRVGHRAPSIEASYLAAVRACGDDALLSGRAAGHLLGLLKGAAPRPEVTAPTERRVPGVSVRRSPLADATAWRGIPVTTVPRTLVDLAAVLRAADLARACHEAGVLHRTTPGQVEAVLARRPTSAGSRELRAVLRGETPVSLSPLESRFLALVRDAGLPLPRTNRPAGTRRVDCRWPDHGLTVELDSYRFHNSRHSWEQDRRREREARARGDELLRYTYGDVFERPGAMLADLRTRLKAASRTSGAPPARR